MDPAKRQALLVWLMARVGEWDERADWHRAEANKLRGNPHMLARCDIHRELQKRYARRADRCMTLATSITEGMKGMI